MLSNENKHEMIRSEIDDSSPREIINLSHNLQMDEEEELHTTNKQAMTTGWIARTYIEEEDSTLIECGEVWNVR